MELSCIHDGEGIVCDDVASVPGITLNPHVVAKVDQIAYCKGVTDEHRLLKLGYVHDGEGIVRGDVPCGPGVPLNPHIIAQIREVCDSQTTVDCDVACQ